jgi:hypothetical protein
MGWMTLVDCSRFIIHLPSVSEGPPPLHSLRMRRAIVTSPTLSSFTVAVLNWHLLCITMYVLYKNYSCDLNVKENRVLQTVVKSFS